MKIVIQNYFLLNFFLILFIVKNVFGKEHIIKNDDFPDYDSKIGIYFQNIPEKEIALNFTEDYYDMTLLSVYTIDINLYSNITFIGNENGTIFDYKEGRKGVFGIYINKENYLKFENIIFENFSTNGQNNLLLFYIETYADKYNIEFNNCTFRNNKDQLISIISKFNSNMESRITMNNCSF